MMIVKWETVLISRGAHFGTTQIPTVSQQNWDFWQLLFKPPLISNSLHKTSAVYEKVNRTTQASLEKYYL